MFQSLPTWLLYAIITFIYIGLMAFYFWRRSHKNEKELKEFLQTAKSQLEKHQEKIHSEANERIDKAFQLIRRLQAISERFEVQAQEEYQKIMQDADAKRKSILDDAQKEAKKITTKADQELENYKLKRQQEIEADMVKLVVNVSQKVVQKRLVYKDQVDLIHQALEEVKTQKQKL